MTKRTTEQTKALLLEHGVAALKERGLTAGVRHIRLSDVAAAAGLTTGAAYRCWENQDGFHQDLSIAAMGWRERQSIATTVEAIRALVDERASWREVVRVGSAHYLASATADGSFVTSIALRSSTGGNPDLAEAAHRRLLSALDAFRDLYSALFTLYGRRFVEPYTLDHFTRTIAAASEGYVLHSMSGHDHPMIERDVPDAGREWSLFGCIVETLIERFTEPVEVTEDAHNVRTVT